jgi:hypothetical protein
MPDPTGGYAGRILACLGSHRIHASFGVTEVSALANRDLIRKMARQGDQEFNHTLFTGFSTNTAPLTWSQRAGGINRAGRSSSD